VIRQAISCDICGTEKRQTNHWFVAYEQAGELRVSGWTSRHRLRTDSKHLCGQTCLHKLIDEFVAKSNASRIRFPIEEGDAETPAPATDASLTSAAAYSEVESSARLIMPSAPSAPPVSKPALCSQLEIVPMPSRPQIENLAPMPSTPIPSEPRYASRSWHAEAWERERARELRANEKHPDIAAHRRAKV
jgi:hypothetical protein